MRKFMRSNFSAFVMAIALVILSGAFVKAWATTTSTINVGGTDYLLFTGFTATGGNGTNYAKLVDGDTATDWSANKSYNNGDPNAPAGDFNGGTDDPAYVEFQADEPIIPKGYVLTCGNENAGFWKPVEWAFKAKLNDGDDWTTIHSSTTTLGAGKTFEIACDNDGDNQYQYFRFEVYEVGTTMKVDLDELQIYAQFTYTSVSARAATCTEYGLTNGGYLRNDGKYFADANGTTELTVGNGLIDKISHTGVHHEASDSNIEYWQCSMCGKYFTDEACNQEVTADEVIKTVFGTLTVGTNGASGYYTLESKTYTLTEDVNTNGYIFVPEGVTATIDLAGHTIDRGLTSAVTNGMVIWVAGSLTVTDSGTGGTIKGGMDSSTEHVSCVMVYSENNGAAFTLQGGTLIGNTSYQYNSAVLAPNNANITISGGKITGDVYGVYSFGNVTVSGGEISGNTTGIWSKSNSVSVSGNPVITNNTNANVMLYYGDASVLTIAGELTDGANIGITAGSSPTDNAPVTITSGYGTYNSNVSPSTYFSLDNNGQIQIGPSEYMTVVMGWNEDRTEIAVGTAMRTVTFNMQGHGSDIGAVSLLSGYKLIEPTEPTAEGWSLVGWFTDEDCTEANEWNFDSGVTSDMTLYALWTQGQTYRVTLPENMIIVNADKEAVGGKYLSGTNIRFKVAPDYVVDGDVKNGTETLTADGDGIYSVTVGNADITITATIKKAAEPNKTLSGSESYTAQNGDVLTGSTSGTVTIPDGASITLSDVSISGGIVCNGSVTITLVGTNSVTGASQKAGIEVGGSGTTLTIKGNGSLTATGGQHSAGIGLSRAWDPANDVIGGNIVIEGGTITATGGSQWGAGIGTGVIYGNGSAKTARLGNITIKGGTVKATGGTDADGIGTGYTYNPCTNAIGTVTIHDGIDKVDASSIKDFDSVVYMHGETDVTTNKTDYFTIGEDGNRRLIVQKPVIADIANQTYTGSAITPEPQVIIGSLSLTKGTDYTYSYTDNTNVGTNAKVTVTFKGDYASLGSVEKTFTIIPAVFVSGGIEHGNVTADKAGAVEDDTVTLTITPGEGYNIGTVSYNDGSEHTLEAVNGVYSFTMPAVSVTISVTFTPIEYTITYDLDGGTATGNPTKYTVESDDFTLANPTKNGSTFAGWTGSNGDTAQTEVKIAKGSTGDRSYKANWEKKSGSTQEDDPSKPTFRAHALKLDGEIAAIFYMNLPQLNGVNYADSYMEFTLSRDRENLDELRAYYADTITTSRTVGQETKIYYGFKCPVASSQMADTITATLHYGDNLTVSQDYSVVQYLDEVLVGNYTGTDKDLMLAIQDYGHYAQLMLSQANNWEIGVDHTTIDAKNPDIASDVETVKGLTSGNASQKSNSSTVIKDIGFALLLETVTTINVYFDIVEGYKVGTEGLKVTVDGTEKSAIPLHDGTQYMIQIPNIPAQDLNKAHAITGNNGGEFSITNLSALSYVNKVLNSAEESIGGVDIATMKNAVTAFYKYHKATLDYMAQ